MTQVVIVVFMILVDQEKFARKQINQIKYCTMIIASSYNSALVIVEYDTKSSK